MACIILYGIKNCDNIKKSRKWLDKNSVEYSFHDFYINGINKPIIIEFLDNIEVSLLINRRSTSWRKLSEEQKIISSRPKIVELLLKNPTLIKRPIVKTKSGYIVGFDQKEYDTLK